MISLSIQEKQAGPNIDPFTQIKNFRKLHGVSYPIASDEQGSVISKFGFSSIPANVIIDRKGRYTYNPDTVEDIVKDVQKLLK